MMEIADRLAAPVEAEEGPAAWKGTGPRGRHDHVPAPRPCDDSARGGTALASLRLPGRLLLVQGAPVTCARLHRALTASGFTVAAVADARAALAATERAEFAYAVVEVQLRERDGLDLIRRLHERHAEMRIVVITDHDSFATVVLALRAGADDYLPMPVGGRDLTDALLGRGPALPPVPETPLGVQRVCWEHTLRVLEQCGRNVSEAARRLRMHRRSLQRILKKRAPYPRAPAAATPPLPFASPSATERCQR